MGEHLGPGCILSALIVLAFTLVFHEPQRPTSPNQVRYSPQPTTASQAVATLDRPAHPPGRQPPAPGAPRRDPAPSRLTHEPVAPIAMAPIIQPAPANPRPLHDATIVAASTVTLVGLSRPVPPGPQPAPATPSVRPATEVKPPPPQPSPRRPATSATVVEPGERLVDVATRVYGTPDAVKTIWQANRDRLGGVDAPVPAGLLIRTP